MAWDDLPDITLQGIQQTRPPRAAGVAGGGRAEQPEESQGKMSATAAPQSTAKVINHFSEE